ncbi:MAG TPA: hypothetical protein VD866_08725 [Urbifossiella sp.]|nr:hypothetical protein [Urbifossiella sp.]
MESVTQAVDPSTPLTGSRTSRNLLFIRRTAEKLDRWRRATSESQLYAARNRLVMGLKWVVEEAASAEQLDGAAAVRGWCDQVFATHCFLKPWPVLFLEAYRSGYVTVAGKRWDEPAAVPDVALPPGLLVSILVEVWAWALGMGEDAPVAGCHLSHPPAPLCTIEPAGADVTLTFRPLEGSGLVAPTRPPELEEFLRYLKETGYAKNPSATDSFQLTLPAVPGSA